VPELRYLTVDGHGDPNTAAEHADALAAPYPVAYAMKFASKADLGRDSVVPPAEGLWWADDLPQRPEQGRRGQAPDDPPAARRADLAVVTAEYV
jgi:hypothetical protein